MNAALCFFIGAAAGLVVARPSERRRDLTPLGNLIGSGTAGAFGALLFYAGCCIMIGSSFQEAGLGSLVAAPVGAMCGIALYRLL